jgi:hypothetical protein
MSQRNKPATQGEISKKKPPILDFYFSDFAKAVLLGGQEPLYIKWMVKRKRDKIQDRLLVVGEYRIFSIKKTLTGKKQV